VTDNSRDHLYNLTEREIDVVELMAKAFSNREIGEQLDVSVETVRMHAKNIYAKLDVSGRQKASLRAIELGLIQPDVQSSESSTHLPLLPTQFVGRARELGELHHIIVNGIRLVTILGAGGMGKTHLALSYAHQHHVSYKDGAYFVPLDAVQSGTGIVSQIIEVLQINVSNKRSYEQQLVDYLADKQMLLVIDNWEHLLDSAGLISRMLRTAPDIVILATSREKLSLLGETVYRLQGLSMPLADDIESLHRSEAVQLLRQTAQTHLTDWDITEDNMRAVHQLCQLTDGMPLGIILAVSWIDVYPLEQIIREIRKNIDFLQTDIRNIPARHQSILSVFEWTWQLLSDDEQAVFMKLSVFRNGCSLDAIEAVTGASPHVLHALVSKALIYRLAQNRYDIHELLRQYGYQKLQQDQHIEYAVRDNHAQYYFDIADQMMTNELIGDIAEVELENVYVAWQWAVDSDNTEMLWQGVNTYGIIAYQLGNLIEMKGLYEYALARQPELDYDLRGALFFVIASINSYLQDFNSRDEALGQAYITFNGRDLSDLRLEVVYTHYHGVLATRLISWDVSLNALDKIIHELEQRYIQSNVVYLTMVIYAYSQRAHIMTRSPTYKPDTINVKDPALKALRLAKKIQHHAMIGLIASILGEQSLLIRRYDEAATYFRDADEAYRGLNSPYDHADALVIAGSNAYVIKDYDLARNYLKRALDLLVDFKHSPPMAFIIHIVAHWKITMGSPMEAISLIAYARHHFRDPYSNSYLSYILEGFNVIPTSDEEKIATERGQLMSFDEMVRELYAWLEE